MICVPCVLFTLGSAATTNGYDLPCGFWAGLLPARVIVCRPSATCWCAECFRRKVRSEARSGLWSRLRARPSGRPGMGNILVLSKGVALCSLRFISCASTAVVECNKLSLIEASATLSCARTRPLIALYCVVSPQPCGQPPSCARMNCTASNDAARQEPRPRTGIPVDGSGPQSCGAPSGRLRTSSQDQGYAFCSF
jgi:hypothetical protein